MIETLLNKKANICGIFITHAHMGHYMGLMELGLEVLNTQKMPVYVMAKMKSFLEENAPFTQLVEQNNIQLQKMEEDASIKLNKNINITPFLVPHRNEFSETVGFNIQSVNKSILYIPDIDSWDTWDLDINDLIRRNDILLLDGTFYNNEELPGRNLQDVPHPFIKESLQKFSLLEEVDRDKVYFTHLNHSNPVIQISSLERSMVYEKGCHIAEDGMLFAL
jgi:pyrroloquinoline quinone biosynthesis protein B